MSELEEIERWMQSVLRFPAEALHEDAQHYLLPSSRLAATGLLSIYQRGYYARLLECMGRQFRALKHALGTELFDDFARLYLQKHPSRSHTLAVLGAGFAAHLEATRPDRDVPPEGREAWIDFLVDLARFEWSLYEMFDRPGEEDRGYAIAETADEQLRLQSCFALQIYRYPVGGYYHLVSAGKDPDVPPAMPTHLAIARKHYRTGIYALRADQAALMAAISETGSVPAALERNADLREVWEESRGGWIEAGFFATSTH